MSLRQLDLSGSGALGARFQLEGDSFSAAKVVEFAVDCAAMEEILGAIFAVDEPESTF
jgi:hypothetical protein